VSFDEENKINFNENGKNYYVLISKLLLYQFFFLL